MTDQTAPIMRHSRRRREILDRVARIGDMAAAEGLFAESMAAALAQTSDDARAGLQAFLARQPPKFGA